MLAPLSSAPAEPSIADLARQVVTDGRAAVEAEVGVVKAIAAYRLSGVKIGLPLLVAALFFLQAVITTLLVGLILTLTPELGVGWSTLLVVLVGFATVGLLAWLGVKRLGSLWAPLPTKDARL